MSHTVVVAPIMSALVKVEDVLGKDRIWHARNQEQKEFLVEFFSKRSELAKFSERELRSWVSFVADELNAILKTEGFDIRLDEFEEGEFGVVSILDILVEWLAAGTKFPIRTESQEYAGVKMMPSAEIDSQPARCFMSYESKKHPYPVALVLTKSGDRVYMTVADEELKDFSLVRRIDMIRSSLESGGRYEYLLFPMVDLNHEPDVSWLLKMCTIDEGGQAREISQAKQQTKFKMNQFGARVKSAVAIGIGITSVQREMPLVIDKPFFLWIEREGATIPVLYAYLDYEEWKNPGDLSNM